MTCDPASSGQEIVYLKALEGAQKNSVKDGNLLLLASEFESEPSLQFRSAAAEESNKNGG